MECVRTEDITPEISSLYEISFSPIEKIPYENIRRTFGEGGELLSFSDDGAFIGFSFLYRCASGIFLVYLAVRPDIRSKGYGARMLSAIRDTYPGCDIFLPMEPLDPGAGDIDMRRRRYGFYIRNGCTDSGYTVISDGYPFQILFLQGSVSKGTAESIIGEYEDLHNGRVRR